GKKRKRTQNTSKEQYELYLSFLENDYAFRSGTINPTLSDNYIPQKRFTDWKYATRIKYRKKCQHRSQTGSGPQSDITLSELEERALSAWGKIVVTGNNDVTQYEGLEVTSNINTDGTNMDNTICDNIENITTDNTAANINIQYIEDDNLTYNVKDSIILTDENAENLFNESVSQNNPTINIETVSKEITTKTPKSGTTMTSKKRYSVPRVKPLSVLTEKLLESNVESSKTMSEFNNIFKQFTENYINILKKNLEYKKNKLDFTIAKFKLLNPGFESIDKNM
ncbi:hypothetical protein X777_07420, partial [Ooceraea biroi]